MGQAKKIKEGQLSHLLWNWKEKLESFCQPVQKRKFNGSEGERYAPGGDMSVESTKASLKDLCVGLIVVSD